MDKLGLQGRVTVFQEDDGGEREYIIKNQRNHFTDGMLRGLLSFIVGSTFGASETYGANRTTTHRAWYYDWNILTGVDIVTPTNHVMTGLVSPIATNPNTKICEGLTTISDAERYINWTSVWNANTISGDVGEMGLWFRPFTNISPSWSHVYSSSSNGTSALASTMCSRLSSASGDFSPFSIDPSRSLTITWELGVRYV